MKKYYTISLAVREGPPEPVPDYVKDKKGNNSDRAVEINVEPD